MSQTFLGLMSDGTNEFPLKGNADGLFVQSTADTGAATSLAIMDDWDESDRAKVNPIVGQAGVAAGAGAVGATVQRTTLASDDPAVAALQIMDDWDESDRAKVNLIVGSAGVAGGSGTVSATTQRVCLATDVALPAGTNLLGRVSSSPETSTVYNGTTALTPKFAAIDVASSGDNTLVAAVSAKKIRVVSLYLVASAAVTVRFESGASGTALSGQMQLAANGGFVLPFNPAGWFETAADALLNLELSGNTSVDGGLGYVEV